MWEEMGSSLSENMGLELQTGSAENPLRSQEQLSPLYFSSIHRSASFLFMHVYFKTNSCNFVPH